MPALLAVGATLGATWVLLQLTNAPDQDPRLRKLRITVDGLGRFFRAVRLGLGISLDYHWYFLTHKVGFLLLSLR